MKSSNVKKTNYTGVRYREHQKRKLRNGQKDKYFFIRYQSNKKEIEEGVGWASEGWTADKAFSLRCTIKKNIKTGSGPQSLVEMRQCPEPKQVIDDDLIDVFFDRHYLPIKKRTKRSWRTDENRFNKIIRPVLAGARMADITTSDIQKIVDSLIDLGQAPATVKQYRDLLRNIFNVAKEIQVDGQILFTGGNPCRKTILPAVHNQRERFLTKDEADLIIQAARRKRCPDIHDAILLSLYAGLRMGEIQRLEWIDVNFSTRILSVKKEAKRKPGGQIPMNDVVFDVLFRRHSTKDKNCPKVFPAQQGGIVRRNLSAAFRKIADECGLNEGIDQKNRVHRIVFHSLRHTFASWLAISGTDIYRIKTLMRHKNISMTMRYAHLIPDATRDAVNSLKAPDHYNSGSSQETPRATNQSTSDSFG